MCLWCLSSPITCVSSGAKSNSKGMFFTCRASGAAPANTNTETGAGPIPAPLYREPLATPWANVTKLKFNSQSGLGVIVSYRYHSRKTHKYAHTHTSAGHAQWIVFRPTFVDSIFWPTGASAAVILWGKQVYLHLSSCFSPPQSTRKCSNHSGSRHSLDLAGLTTDELSEVCVILCAAGRSADIFRPMPVSIYAGLLLKFHFSSLGQPHFLQDLPEEVELILLFRKGLTSIMLKPKAK